MNAFVGLTPFAIIYFCKAKFTAVLVTKAEHQNQTHLLPWALSKML